MGVDGAVVVFVDNVQFQVFSLFFGFMVWRQDGWRCAAAPKKVKRFLFYRMCRE